jgi:hypothetical protein
MSKFSIVKRLNSKHAIRMTIMIAALALFLGFYPFVSSFVFGATQGVVTFSPIQNLSNDPQNSTAPVVAAVGTNVYVAWEDRPSLNTHIETYFTSNNNSGTAGYWKPITMFSGMSGTASPQTSAVQIAAVGSDVFLTWNQGTGTAYAISTNNGTSFTYNVLNVSSTYSSGTQSGEAVAACGSYAYFTFADSTSSAKPIFIDVAHVSGSTVTVNPVATPISGSSSRHGEDEVACSGNIVYVTWDSIYVTQSYNNGATFTAPKQISPTGGVAGSLSREPMVAACGSYAYITFPSSKTPDGSYQTFVVVGKTTGTTTTWAAAQDISYGYLENSREVQVTCQNSYVYITSRGESSNAKGTQQYIYVSSNNGTSFAPPSMLGPKLANPENGFGGVRASGNNVYVTWIHNPSAKGVQQIFFASNPDNGTGGVSDWTQQQVSSSTAGVVGYGDPNGGQGPLIATSIGIVYLVWQDNSVGGGDIFFTSS